MRRIPALSFLVLFCASLASFANTSFTQRKDVQHYIKSLVQQHHFDEKQLVAIMNTVVLRPQIIESMEKPYEKKNWDVYSALFLTPERVKAGIDFWQAHHNQLAQVEKRFGVPAEIIVAILGVETLYGTRQGNYKVLDALATLAFTYPKRSVYFTKELTEYLLLCKEQGVAAGNYYGSYAGAIGQPQFMPSSYRYYAVDFNNKGNIDLVHNTGDVFASVANYFKKHGWQNKEGIVQEAKVAGHTFKTLHFNPKTPNYGYAQLIKAGVRPLTAAYHHPNKAGVIELTTDTGNAYWLAYSNFFVITRYNSSPQYALAVYLLSQRLKMQWAQKNSLKPRAYV